jgi:ATP synthase protein I
MSNAGSSSGPGAPRDEDAAVAAEDARMRQRLDDLTGRLDRAAGGEKAAAARSSGDAQEKGVGQALRIGTELVAGVAVGSFIGYWVDQAFGTRPIGFVVFFLLGTAAGFLNVMRTARRIQAEMPDIAPETAAVVDDDDDDAAETGRK